MLDSNIMHTPAILSENKPNKSGEHHKNLRTA